MPTIRLNFPHGLGDAVQFTVILKHLRRHRPDWTVDVRCGRGKHSALTGHCRRAYHDQEPEPSGPYDTVADIGWYENYHRYVGRPNSKITNCLAEVFGLDYDSSLGRYEIRVSAEPRARARAYLVSIGCTHGPSGKLNAVLIHYQGNTSDGKKNFDHWQFSLVCDMVRRCGRIPVILDWDRRSSLPDGKKIFTPGCGQGDVWGGFGSGDAETLAAMIGWSEAFIGIDSGPGKVASATDTPSLICWKGHHPVQFHDPAPNTVHLIPWDHRKLPPVEGHSAVADWFERHYLWRTYRGEHDLVARVRQWLAETLGCSGVMEDMAVPFVLPQGIGDSVWALLKIKALANGKPIDVILAGDPRQEVCLRAVPFVKRFPFVRDVSVLDVPHLEHGRAEDSTDPKGRYLYVPDGERGGFHYLMPNKTLEEGKRIEEWLPGVPLDWGIIEEFSWKDTEKGKELGRSLEPFAAFYLGPESGNTTEGHNRDWLWEPRDWMALGRLLVKRGLKLALIGASYDKSFWERYCRAGFVEAGIPVLDLLGRMEIGDTFALLRHAKVFVSYQSGLAIFAQYLGVHVVSWWRPEGNSCHHGYLVSFDEKMRDAWTRPEYQDRYMGLIYKTLTPGDIVAEMDRKGWL